MYHLIDSSAWLEYFAGSEIAAPLDPIMEDPSKILLSPLTISEVFRSLLQQTTASNALRSVAHMQAATTIAIDEELSLSAARLGVKNELHLFDCYHLAICKRYDAQFWTTNEDLARLPQVQILKPKNELKSFRLYR